MSTETHHCLKRLLTLRGFPHRLEYKHGGCGSHVGKEEQNCSKCVGERKVHVYTTMKLKSW